MSTSAARTVFLAFLLALCLVVLTARVAPGQRVFHEGETWLSWSHSEREEYVWGFSSGYADGYEDACRVMDKLWKGPKGARSVDDPLTECIAKETSFSRDASYYADAVTEFYRRYPGDRDIMVWEVLEQLGKGLTLEQIHRYPFMERERPVRNGSASPRR